MPSATLSPSVIAGHIAIADNTSLMGMSAVTGTIREAGVYSSPIPVQPVQQWRRNAARFSKLDEMYKRMRTLEREIQELKSAGQNSAMPNPNTQAEDRAAAARSTGGASS